MEVRALVTITVNCNLFTHDIEFYLFSGGVDREGAIEDIVKSAKSLYEALENVAICVYEPETSTVLYMEG